MATTTARTVATITRKAGATVATRKAPARDKATPRTAPALVVSIDGAEPVAVPFKLSDFVHPGEFAADVLAALVWAHTGKLPTSLPSIGGASGFYCGVFNCGRSGKVHFAFGSPVVVEAYRVKRNEASAIDAEPAAPAPVVSAEPAPAKPAGAKVTPQVAPLAGMSPLGLKPAAVAPKALPAPAVAAAMKASAASARDTRTLAMVRVTVEGHGTFDVHCSRADMAEPASFARMHIAPRVALFHEWPRVAVDYASRGSASEFLGAVSYGGKRQSVVWCECPVTAAPPARPLPVRAGMGKAERSAVAAPMNADALAARMGVQPAGAAVAAAEARAKAAGIKLSRIDRAAAEALDAAQARISAGTVKAEAAPRMNAANRAIFDAAAKGVLPTPPDFSAATHERYRGKLAELVAMVRKGDVAGLKAYHINPISTSPKALDKYRNAAVIALTAKAEKKAARLAA